MVTRNKEGYFIKIKKSNHQENTIIDIYLPSKKNPKICEAKTDRIIGRNKQFNINSWGLQNPIFNNG